MTDPRPPSESGAALQAAPSTHDDPAVAPRARHRIAPRHYLWLAGAVLVVVFALHWLGAVLTPFLIGAIFAYLGRPLVSVLARRRVPRALGALLVITLFGVAILALFLILAPLIQAEFALATKRLPELFGSFTERFAPWVEQKLGIKLALDLVTLRDFLAANLESVQELSMHVLAGVRTGGLILVSLVINLALIPVVMFYLLKDWDMLVGRVDELVPLGWRAKVRQIAKQIDAVLAEFLRGQLSVMTVLAVFYAIGLWIAGLEFALPVGVLTGLLVFIPYVGFGLGLVLGIVAALLQWSGWPDFFAILSVYALGQILENYVLIPWLVGDRIGLHPLAVIFALLAFGALFGVAGVLLALPVSAALLVGLRHLRAAYVASPLYRGD